MAEEPLVNDDIDAAGKLVEFLDTHGFPVKAALWLYQSDMDKWRFLVAFQEQRKDITSFYLDVANKLHSDKERESILDLSRVDIVRSDDQPIGALSSMVRVEGGGRVRFKNNRLNGVYVEDALIYRLSA